MTTIEEEYDKLKPVIQRLSKFSLLGKKMDVRGECNFVKSGPNIIVGNHIGTFKDIATLFEIMPRNIFFTANRMIFDKDDFNSLIQKHLKRHLNNFGLFLDLLLKPVKSPFVNFISNNIHKVGAIPVDLYKRRRPAIHRCQDYLRQGRAIVLLQGRGRIMKKDSHPYVTSFRRGVSIISYNLYSEDNLSVPITPIAFFGTQIPFLIPGKIKVNVGEPMYIRDYWGGSERETIDGFRLALEERVKTLFLQLLPSEGKQK